MALVISMAILASAIGVFNGRQVEAQFNQALYDVQSKFQNYVSQATNKVVPGYQQYSCSSSGGGDPRPVLTPAGAGETTGNACIYLGQAIQFIKDDSVIYEYPVFGFKNVGGDPSADFAATANEASPEPAWDGSNLILDTPYFLSDNLKIKFVHIVGDNRERDLLTFYSSLQDSNTSGNVVTPMAIAKTFNSQSIPQLKNCIETQGCGNDNASLLNQTLQVCMTDPGGTKSASLYLRGGVTGVTTEVKKESC